MKLVHICGVWQSKLNAYAYTVHTAMDNIVPLSVEMAWPGMKNKITSTTGASCLSGQNR